MLWHIFKHFPLLVLSWNFIFPAPVEWLWPRQPTWKFCYLFLAYFGVQSLLCGCGDTIYMCQVSVLYLVTRLWCCKAYTVVYVLWRRVDWFIHNTRGCVSIVDLVRILDWCLLLCLKSVCCAVLSYTTGSVVGTCHVLTSFTQLIQFHLHN